MGQEPYHIGIVDDDTMTLIGLQAVIVSQRSKFTNNAVIIIVIFLGMCIS